MAPLSRRRAMTARSTLSGVEWLLQQNSGNKRCRCSKQPFDAPHLNRLKLRQIGRSVNEADGDSSGDAAETDHERDHSGRGQTDPTFNLMKMEIPQPTWQGHLAPGSRNGGGVRTCPRHLPNQEARHHRCMRADSHRHYCRTAETAGMAKPGADHELRAAIGTGLGHFRSRGGKCGLQRRFEHGRRPPKVLLRILNYLSHNEVREAICCKASRQPKAPPPKVFSSQILATFP
jgi:hypothetical protein